MSTSPESDRSSNAVDNGKRRLLGLRGRDRAPAIRPPWSIGNGFTDACTRCGDCIQACPESVLLRGDGGFPEFDPSLAGAACTFCGACAEACPEGLFDRALESAINAEARISETACLAAAGIHCECCRDSCDAGALRFRPKLGGPPEPVLDADLCTACGACLAVCPNQAIHLIPADQATGTA